MNFVALDLETTGTLSHLDHIVELAAVRFSEEGESKQVFSTLVNPGPGVSIPEEATLVNGITDEMLKDKPTIDQVLKDFSKFCAQDILVAHNAIFDFQFLSEALKKCHFVAPGGPLFDTYTLSKKVFPGLSNYKLSTLVEYLKIPVSKFHRAEQDALACGKLFYMILKKLKPFKKNLTKDFYTSNFPNKEKLLSLSLLGKLTQVAGKKELRFPAPKSRQLSLFDIR